MLTVGNKQIPETLAELIDPAWTVLVVHDVQNDYSAPGGKLFSKSPEPVGEAIRAAVASIVPLVAAARQAGVRIVYTRATHLEDGADESPVHLRHLLANNQRGGAPNVLVGSWGHAIVGELTPQPGDAVIDKYAFSAFQGTPLDKLLRSFGTRTIVLAGMASHSGILTSARFALTLDYFTVIPRECTAGTSLESHAAAMTLLGPDLEATAEIIDVWSTA